MPTPAIITLVMLIRDCDFFPVSDKLRSHKRNSGAIGFFDSVLRCISMLDLSRIIIGNVP